MNVLLAALGGLACATALPLLLWRWDRLATRVGVLAGTVSCAIGLAGSLQALLSASSASWKGPWGLPIGELRLGIDPLSALFLCCLFGAGLACCVYGGRYLQSWLGKKRVAWVAAGFNLLVACVAIIFLARDGIVFLLAWEGMALSSFLLIGFEHERAEVRDGALWYLVFNHLGVACLFGFFALLGRELGTYALPAASIAVSGSTGAALLGLGLLGFGTKAGLAPLHIWLPAAHPVAPSHVSAMLSGVLLKTGIYGLFRVLLVGRPPAEFAWVLIALGAFSAVLGAVNLIATTDLKRSLAYSSIENVGIIVLSMGVGALGLAKGSPLLAALGFAGALLHVISHTVFKSLLFIAAGSVVHATHTRRLDAMGGLARRMPATASVFLIGAGAAAAIPGLAGFASEFFVYRSLLEALQHLRPAGQVMAAAGLTALAFTGGLVAAGMARAFGVAFSGTPRTEAAAMAHEQPAGMVVPMALLGAACLALGLVPRAALALVAPVITQAGLDPRLLAPAISQATLVGELGFALLALCAGLAAIRGWLLSRALVAAGPTWGCGYLAPTPRMQYTAASFADPIVRVVRSWLDTQQRGIAARLAFPPQLDHEFTATDRVETSGYRRALAFTARQLAVIRALHRPNLQQYLVYIFVALLVLLSYAARLVRP